MHLSQRYGLAGIGALALLSCVQWARNRHWDIGPFAGYVLGVAPNFAAAIAIIFVLLSVWADQARDASFWSARSGFYVCAGISGGGLLGWELMQRTSGRFVFDGHDLLATLAGIATATWLFYRMTPRRTDADRP